LSIRGKEVRPLIEPEQINELAARLLEKAIAGEWHEVRLLLSRSERLGKRWRAVEAQGKLFGSDGMS